MTLRSDLQQVIDEVDAADRAADEIVAPLGETKFHRQPDEGRAWSIAQCIDHLATINVFYGAAIERAVEHARQRGVRGGGPIAPTFFGARFLSSLEPPVKLRSRAPASVTPRSAGTRDDIRAAYHASHDRFRELVRSCADVDVNRARFQNPFFPIFKVRVGTGLRVIPAHDRRHLWQARQVVAKMPGPAGK
ncbi:MAG: DinB family protein [Acidobacteria bacterium]|nr:DinB family protein [Acidobacteriota bacterium]